MGRYKGRFEEKQVNQGLQEKKSPILKIVAVLVIICLAIAVVSFALKAKMQKPVPVPTEQQMLEVMPTVPAETEPAVTEVPEETQPAEEMLPRLHIQGDISQMLEKSDERTVAFVYENGGETMEGYLKIKIQGTSSLDYEKKNYTVNLYRDQNCSEELALDMGWGAQSSYCLRANWIDKTHARNVVTARIAAQVQEKYNVLPDTPNQGLIDGFPVEIYNNDEFLGLYTWNIPKGAWLLNMDESNPKHIVLRGEYSDMITYFIAPPDYTNAPDGYTSWAVEVGKDDDQVLEKLNRLHGFVMSSTNEEFKEKIHEYFDLDALINYYLVTDIAFLRDNLGKNMLLFSYDSESWYLGLYDLDSSWGMNFDGKSLLNYEQEAVGSFMNYLFTRLENCFADELQKRYFELREDLFTKEHILSEFSAFRDEIPEEVFEREQLRWGAEIPGYGYDQIEAYLDYMIPVLDKKYADWTAWQEYRYQFLLAYIESTGADETVLAEAKKVLDTFYCVPKEA